MPANDKIHDAVKTALIKDGWTITDDPYTIDIEGEKLYVDLAAERTLAAERNGEKIAVEIKSFLSPSIMQDLEAALGQYQIYSALLKRTAPERRLYLAVSDDAYLRLMRRKIFQRIKEDTALLLLIVAVETEEVTEWIE